MSINNRFLFSSVLNQTWPKYVHEKHWKIVDNHTDQSIRFSTNSSLSSSSWIIHRLTILQRSFFILSLFVLFWIIFIVIYMSSRLIVRLVSNFKYFPFPSASESPSASNEKISRAFIISPHQYGSFRPRHIPSPLLNRSDSLFSHSDFQVPTKSSSSTTTNQISLLEHYLQSYNPLKIDLTNIHDGTVKTSIVQRMPSLSDTDTQPIRNCYALICTNKQKFTHSGRRYVRLEEQENCSTTRSILLDDHLSECSTKLSNITLPTLMITDCSDQQRLHTQIIELNEEKKDDE